MLTQKGVFFFTICKLFWGGVTGIFKAFYLKALKEFGYFEMCPLIFGFSIIYK